MMERLLRRFLIPPLILLMLFPWTRLTDAFDSDIQPYSLFYALLLLLPCAGAFVAQGNWRLTKGEGFALLAALLLFVELLVVVSISGGTEALRGGYQYLNGAVMFLLMFFLMKIYRGARTPFVSDYVVVTAFAVWVLVGVVQMMYDKSFMTFLVSRSVVTSDRGAISLSSEPGYFGYTLMFFGLYFAMVGKRYLAGLAFLLIPVLTMSAASVAFLLILGVIFLAFRYGARGLLLMLVLGACAYGAGAVLTSVQSLAEYRVIALLRHLYQDKAALVMDGSINIRLVHLYYSHLGFIESKGLPNGVVYWPTYLANRIGDVSFLWDTGLNQTSRINSGMGGILFEGGWFSVLVVMSILGMIRSISANKQEFLLYAAVFVYLFYIGYNFRIPFLYLLLFAALARHRRQGLESECAGDEAHTQSRLPVRGRLGVAATPAHSQVHGHSRVKTLV